MGNIIEDCKVQLLCTDAAPRHISALYFIRNACKQLCALDRSLQFGVGH